MTLHIADHMKYYKSLYEKHKGEWLTDFACMEYWERAKRLANRGNQDIGEKRKLREELQERYGLQEMVEWIEPYLKIA